MPNPAIYFEPTAYAVNAERLMGVNAASNGFLRAAVRGRESGPLTGVTRSQSGFQAFAAMVAEVDPAAAVERVASDRPDLLQRTGLIYLGDPQVAAMSRLRLRAGPAAYSLCGLTHTISSPQAMDAICGLLTSPVMPWDALICTSRAVASAVQALLERQHDYLAWLLGSPPPAAPLQTPIIPLGVNAGDFAATAEERSAARARQGLADDEVAVLYVGRLNHRTKAHPFAMYAGLQAAVERTGGAVALIQCGRFEGEPEAEAFRAAARQVCPSVRALFVDGRDPADVRACWAAADIFISLSDNLQESFGLTPLEAMAAGLPVVVSDWNGYRDTVQDGTHGFRIPTWSPAAGAGARFAGALEALSLATADYYGVTSKTISIDLACLTERLSDLIADPQLRRRMGEAGRRTACEAFDWARIYARYQALWAELGERRRSAQADPAMAPRLAAAPKAAPRVPDPFDVFASYPTRQMGPQTRVRLARPDPAPRLAELIADPLLKEGLGLLPDARRTAALLETLGQGAHSLAQLQAKLGLSLDQLQVAAGFLAKVGIVSLDAE